jgi:peptide/nickel transport system permease protein
MIDELNRPWVKVARAKGMPFRRVVGVHALRNAAVPVVTLGGWELIRMLAGATVIVETIFAWPGIGLTALQAVERNDLFLLQTVVLVVATVTVLLNIAIDVAYKFIDPRIKLS